MKTLKENLLRQNDKLLTNNYAEQSPFQESLPSSFVPIFSGLRKTGFSIAPVSGKKVAIDFNGGSVSSDAGVLLLSETERQTCQPSKREQAGRSH